jgi:hypothetical protein
MLVTTRLFLLVCVSVQYFFSLSTNFFNTQKTHEMTHQKQWHLTDRTNGQIGKQDQEISFSHLLALFTFFNYSNPNFEIFTRTAYSLTSHSFTFKSVTLFQEVF